MVIAAAFFFALPVFGLAPKTILVLYLAVSFLLIIIWRLFIFSNLPRAKRLRGVLIASGVDAPALAEAVKNLSLITT